MRLITGFGRFWYDFIVGDSAVLAVGTVALLVVGWLLVRAGGGIVVELFLPFAALATLVVSLSGLDGLLWGSE
jgi:hypothetical protein